MLTTARLELIPLTARQLKLWLADVPALERELDASYCAEPLEGVFRHIVRGQCEKVEREPGSYLFRSFWFVLRKTDRVVVGSCDFKDIPNERREVEIGYGLGKAFEGQGYMTEAIRAFCEWALAREGIAHVVAETEKGNPRSERLLQRIGFTPYMQKDTAWWRL